MNLILLPQGKERMTPMFLLNVFFGNLYLDRFRTPMSSMINITSSSVNTNHIELLNDKNVQIGQKHNIVAFIYSTTCIYLFYYMQFYAFIYSVKCISNIYI